MPKPQFAPSFGHPTHTVPPDAGRQPSAAGPRPGMDEIRRRLEQQGRVTPPSALHHPPGLQPPQPGVSKTPGPPLHVPPTPTARTRVDGPHGPGRDLGSFRFADRYKSGQLDPLTKGEVAQKLKLADQFKLLQQGDSARRLNLTAHPSGLVGIHHGNVAVGGNAAANLAGIHRGVTPAASLFARDYPFYHGHIHPAYTQQCFKHPYWGSPWFAGECWYPHWRPWVNWSWHHHCHPLWDPRPIWCRPVIYEPCPVWVWWPTPVWVSLPVVTCGTWVDVPPAAVREAFDLQLLAVRFVDPGHPEEKLGPRYRVWFRNNSVRPITRPFNVVLLASNDGRLAANLPQAGVRITSIEASDTQSVDVRLPIEVYAMGRDAQGNPVPFGALHAIVDSHREIEETTETNNGVQLARADILPVDPASFQADPVQVAAGGEVVLAGEGYGPQPGQVLVHLGGLELDAEVLGWYDLGVRLTMPRIPLAAATPAELIVIRGDGAAANPVKVTVLPPQAAAAAKEIPFPQLP